MRRTKYKRTTFAAGLLGLMVMGLALALAGCTYNARTRETWLVELLVDSKDLLIRESEDVGSEDVYLIIGQDADGKNYTFELTDTVLADQFEASQAFNELKAGKYYKFRVGWRNRDIAGKDGYYPSIYNSVALQGFTPDESDGTEEGKASTEYQGEEHSRDGKETAASDGHTGNQEQEQKENTESVGQEVLESIKESLEASLEESFQAERESLEREIENLRGGTESQDGLKNLEEVDDTENEDED